MVFVYHANAIPGSQTTYLPVYGLLGTIDLCFYCFFTMSFPQQHLGFWFPEQVGDGPLVTVISQPQFESGHL